MPANARRTGRLLFLVYCTFLMGRHSPTGHAVYIVVGGRYAWQCAKIQRCPRNLGPSLLHGWEAEAICWWLGMVDQIGRMSTIPEKTAAELRAVILAVEKDSESGCRVKQ